MTPGQGRPLTLDAGWIAALCGGGLVQLLAPFLLPIGLLFPLMALALLLAVLAWWMARGALAPSRAIGARLLAWASAFMLGASLCGAHGHAAMERRPPAELQHSTLVLDVRILGLVEPRPKGVRFVAEIEGVPEASPGVARVLESRRIALDWYGGGSNLQPGERWRLGVRLRPWTRPLNPGDPDEARRALVSGVDARGVVQSNDRPLRLGPPGGVHAARAAISERISGALGAEQGRFVAALAVGDTRALSDEDWEQLRRFGLTHLIAISGFHVGMVAGLGILLVRALWWCWPMLAHWQRRRPAAAVAAVVVGTAYAGLAGFSLPTLRTVLMIAVVALFVVRRQRGPWAQPLLLAMAILVLADPFALLTPGFWLSCGGVAWLLWCLPGTSSAWHLGDFLKAQWVATLGLLPIGAAFFLQLPVAGPLANLVAIPWISLVVVPLSLLGTLLLPVSRTLSTSAWQTAAIAMDGLWWILGSVPEPVAASRWLPSLEGPSIALALLGVAILLLPRGVRWRPMGAVLVLPMLFPAVPRPPAGEFSVTVFALPRGDALLIRTASRNVLVDAGPPGMDLARRLRAAGVESVDARIETRRNAGRLGGADAVDRAFDPAIRWAAPGTAFPVAGQGHCEAGRRWAADGVEFLALSPAPAAAGTSPDESCVLHVRSASGVVAWLVSDSGPWVARRTASPSVGAWVFAAPAALEVWSGLTAARGAVATRAPGPSLSQRWPEALHRVDRSGALVWRSDAPGAPEPLHGGARRWWFPAPG